MMYEPHNNRSFGGGLRSRRQSLSYGADPYYSTPMQSVGLHPESIYQTPGNMSRYSLSPDVFEDDYYEDPGYTSSYSTSSRRSRRLRRASTYDRSRSSTPFLDSFRRLMNLKFKPKGTHRSGVTLTEALDNIRISGDKTYSPRSLNADSRGNLYMRIVWAGYPTLTYEVPIDGYDGRISLQTLMRRVARGCVHFVQSRGIPIHPDRIILHSVEEVTSGTWQPLLTVE
jgi:hypothetical protein